MKNTAPALISPLYTSSIIRWFWQIPMLKEKKREKLAENRAVLSRL